MPSLSEKKKLPHAVSSHHRQRTAGAIDVCKVGLLPSLLGLTFSAAAVMSTSCWASCLAPFRACSLARDARICSTRCCRATSACRWGSTSLDMRGADPGTGGA